MTILDTIVADKRVEVAARKAERPIADVRAALQDAPAPRSLRKSIETKPGGIIAEFKRRSPSKDWIRREARVEEIIPAYSAAGAAGLSILTDHKYFGGSLADVIAARPLTDVPILRKEFVVDEYQLVEARAAGADAVLLIAAVLGAAQCHEFAGKAHDLGLEVLLEIHEESELACYSTDVDLIGVNNRNLHLFKTDVQQSIDLFPLLPKGALPISESGLLQVEKAQRVKAAGYRGLLIGEAFMAKSEPGEALRCYIEALG